MRKLLLDTGRGFVEDWHGLLAPFCASVGFGMFGIGLPLLLQKTFAVTEAELSWLVAFTGLVYAVGAPLGGLLADGPWRLRLLWAAPAAMIACAVTGYLIHWLWMAYVAAFFLQLCGSMFWPSLIKTVSQSRDPLRVLRRIVIFSMAGTCGFAIGQQIGGVLKDISVRLPFLGCGVVAIAVWPLVRHSLRHHEVHREDATPNDVLKPPGPVRRRWYLWLAWAGDIVTVGTLAVVHSYFPLLGARLGLSGTAIGFLMLLCGLAPVAGFFVLGVFPNWWYYRLWPLVAVESCAIVGCLIVGRFTHPVLLGVALIGVGFATSLSYLASVIYGVIGTRDPGAKSGLHEGLIAGGCVVVPWIAGQSINWFGWTRFYPAAYYVSAIVVAGAILVQIAMGAYVVRAERVGQTRADFGNAA